MGLTTREFALSKVFSPLFLAILLFNFNCFAGDLVKRSKSERAAFQRQNPCPSTNKVRGKCDGYVVDHIVALACGGADKPSNMQWQTIAEAKAKDKWERKGCVKR